MAFFLKLPGPKKNSCEDPILVGLLRAPSSLFGPNLAGMTIPKLCHSVSFQHRGQLLFRMFSFSLNLGRSCPGSTGCSLSPAERAHSFLPTLICCKTNLLPQNDTGRVCVGVLAEKHRLTQHPGMGLQGFRPFTFFPRARAPHPDMPRAAAGGAGGPFGAGVNLKVPALSALSHFPKPPRTIFNGPTRSVLLQSNKIER